MAQLLANRHEVASFVLYTDACRLGQTIPSAEIILDYTDTKSRFHSISLFESRIFKKKDLVVFPALKKGNMCLLTEMENPSFEDTVVLSFMAW